MSNIYEYCLIAIQYTETLAKDDQKMKAEKKLAFAIQYVCTMLKNKYPTLDVQKYMQIISMTIESILATPQKKS